jgi:hypothetical protein
MINNNSRTRFFLSPLVVCGILFVSANSSLAYQQPTYHGAGPSSTPKTPYLASPTVKAANETYDVVAIGTDVANSDIKVVAKSTLKALQKQLEDEFNQDKKKYQDAKKDKNNHDANTLKPPVKKTIKMLKAGFKTQPDAQKYADEKIVERDKANGKKTADNKNW